MILKKEQYPCGFKAEVKMFSLMYLFFGTLSYEKNNSWDCPLHGKKCPIPKKVIVTKK